MLHNFSMNKVRTFVGEYKKGKVYFTDIFWCEFTFTILFYDVQFGGVLT